MNIIPRKFAELSCIREDFGNYILETVFPKNSREIKAAVTIRNLRGNSNVPEAVGVGPVVVVVGDA